MFRGLIHNLTDQPVTIRRLGMVIPPNSQVEIKSNDLDQFILANDEINRLMLQKKISITNREGRKLAMGEFQWWTKAEFGVRDKYTVPIKSFLNTAVTGEFTWMTDEGFCPHNYIPMLSPQDATIRAVVVQAAGQDPRPFRVSLHTNPHLGENRIAELAWLPPNGFIGVNRDADTRISQGLYGISIDNVYGGGDSAFTMCRVMIFIEPIFL